MRNQAKVVIIGSGIVGASIAYHLTRLGWRNIVVLDQGPLFKNWGSTSHAPGLMFQGNGSKTVCQLARWSVELYLSVVARNVAAFQVGSIEIAYSKERWEELKRKWGHATSWRLESHLIAKEEIQRLVPIMRTDDLLGGLHVPSDCQVKAAVVTEALANIANEAGAVFYPRTPATGITVKNGRVQAVVTSQGTIGTEYVVSAAGFWGPIIGRMAGVSIPLSPMQHLYRVTTPLKELAGETADLRQPFVRDQDKKLYFRQCGQALGFGAYWHAPLPVDADQIPKNETPALFPFLEEHFSESAIHARERFPCLKGAGVGDQFSGMFSFTPDGNSILGESAEVRGFWSAEAVWVTHAGGVGRLVAEWMVDGDPSLDAREVDINRFHAHVQGRDYIRTRACRQYAEIYDIIHPLTQVADPRNLRISPFHERTKALGAVFFESAGWERPQWFESNADGTSDPLWPGRSGWTAQNWSPIIGIEHKATREGVGMVDLTPFAKIMVGGPKALPFLQSLTANQMDQPVGKVIYTAMLNAHSGIKCDLTITRLAEDRFLIVTGAAMAMHDLAWIRMHLPGDGTVHLTDMTSAYCGIGLWGPRAREVLQTVSENDVSNPGFPYLSAQTILVHRVPVLALRISYAGELGWELHIPTEYGLNVWDALWEAGRAHGIRPVGVGAVDSLRLEKGYRLWGAELHAEYNPYEAGLDFAVRLKKGEFIGSKALAQIGKTGIKRKLCCMVFENPAVCVMGKEPIFDGDRVVGHVTSANYGYSVRQSIAYGYMPIACAEEGRVVEIYFFGKRHRARVAREPLYDPENLRLKG